MYQDLYPLNLYNVAYQSFHFFSVPLECVYYLSLSYSIPAAISLSPFLSLSVFPSFPLVLLSLPLPFLFLYFHFLLLNERIKFHNDPFCDLMACLPLPSTIVKSYNLLTMNPRRKLWLSSTRFKIFEMLDRITANGKTYTLVGYEIVSLQAVCSVPEFILGCQGQHFHFYFQEIHNGWKTNNYENSNNDYCINKWLDKMIIFFIIVAWLHIHHLLSYSLEVSFTNSILIDPYSQPSGKMFLSK